MLYPVDASGSSACGFVRVGSSEHRVCVTGARRLPCGRLSFERARLQTTAELSQLLAPHAAALRARMAQATTLRGLSAQLQELAALSLHTATAPSAAADALALPEPAHYARLLDELHALGWRRVSRLSADLRSVELQAQDAAGRSHGVRVELPADYGARRKSGRRERASAVECSVDAPEPLRVAVATQQESVLAAVLKQFEGFLARFQGFWAALDDLDQHTCVLEPQRPTRATGRRRVALETHVSVQLEIDPKAPTAVCELSFFGSDAAVGPLRERWNTALSRWDEARTPRENIASVLGVEFPSPAERRMEEFAVECGICYSYRLEEGSDGQNSTNKATSSRSSAPSRTMIPDRLCENHSCNRPFHEKCLFDWLKALPTARQSFNTVFGECPYCREAISAKFVM